MAYQLVQELLLEATVVSADGVIDNRGPKCT